MCTLDFVFRILCTCTAYTTVVVPRLFENKVPRLFENEVPRLFEKNKERFAPNDGGMRPRSVIAPYDV